MRMTALFLSISMTCCGTFGPMVIPDYHAKRVINEKEMTFFSVRTVPYIWGCTNDREDGVPFRDVTVFAQIEHPNLTHDDTHIVMRVNEREETTMEFPKANSAYSWSLSFKGEEGSHKVEVWWLRGEEILAYRERIVHLVECGSACSDPWLPPNLPACKGVDKR